MITADVVLDSVSPAGHRLTTLRLRYPKFIHGEFMTHRVFSRNASSSRAVPTAKLINEVADPETRVRPVSWGQNQGGMQAGAELTGLALVQMTWEEAAEAAVRHARKMAERGAHKQVVNRVLEPFTHINVVCTATEYDNFFGLRLDAAAQPEMRALAEAMWVAYSASTPQRCYVNDWHLPFVTDEDIRELYVPHMAPGSFRSDPVGWVPTPGFVPDVVKVSVARCARVSYQSNETGRRSTMDEDLALYERLSTGGHWSPFEHQATPDAREDDGVSWRHSAQHGNFVGWRQLRKTLPGEAVAPLPVGYARRENHT